MVKIADHTIDETLVPEKPMVLDVGCRWFNFTNEILKRWPKGRVYCIDPDPAIVDIPYDPRVSFIRKAVVGDARTRAAYVRYSDGGGNYLQSNRWALKPEKETDVIEVPCTSVCLAGRWDIVKLDCEGAEFGILENWPSEISATQISVEFHDFQDPHPAEYFVQLAARLGMTWAKIDPVSVPAFGMGRWDCLLVKK